MSFELSKEKFYNRREVVVDAFVTRMKKLKLLLKKQMIMTQIDYEQYVNKSKTFVFVYKIENMIYFYIENIINRKFCLKLNHKNIDFYKIIKVFNSISIKLQLSSNIQNFHFVFYVHLLSLIFQNLFFLNYIQSFSSFVVIDEKKTNKKRKKLSILVMMKKVNVCNIESNN